MGFSVVELEALFGCEASFAFRYLAPKIEMMICWHLVFAKKILNQIPNQIVDLFDIPERFYARMRQHMNLKIGFILERPFALGTIYS